MAHLHFKKRLMRNWEFFYLALTCCQLQGLKLILHIPPVFFKVNFHICQNLVKKWGGGGGGVGVPNIPILLIHSRSHWACQPLYMLATVIQIRVV